MESGWRPEDPGSLAEDFRLAEREEPPLELWSAVGGVPPFATMLLIFCWALVFCLLAWRRELGDPAFFIQWGASVTHAPPADAAWRLLASTFLHAGPLHLLLNAASMLIFGPAVERIFGRRSFAIVFALGGALASLASLAWRTAVHAGALS
ncbi:MAG TPA: rhomboid family intramembrane serine protease, partial [Terriglobales bacterium]|nr:rhomboid family intramembrane serine protease [Terriglobales bacterium]